MSFVQEQLKINVIMPHVIKKTTSEKRRLFSNKKLGLQRNMNGSVKPFIKKPISKNKISKIEKQNSKNQSEIISRM